jgi:chemotaxis signal transduction protein
MRPAPPVKHVAARTEQIILFRVSGQLFAVSSSSVKEVRAADSLTTSASEVSHPSLRKVKHVVRRGPKPLFIVSGALHFGLPPAPAALVFVLRHTQTALLIDGIEKMTTMTRLQALPQAFCHEERQWYRGLTALDQSVIPVIAPEGFLTREEIDLLDASLAPEEAPQDELSGEAGWTQ